MREHCRPMNKLENNPQEEELIASVPPQHRRPLPESVSAFTEDRSQGDRELSESIWKYLKAAR